MDPQPGPLHDIPDPGPLLPGIEIPAWFWITAGLVAAGLVVLLAAWLRRRPATSDPDPAYYENCRSALRKLRTSAPSRPLGEVATGASLALRRYLSQVLGDPALYETREETLARTDMLADLPAGGREQLIPLLEHLAACKYSPSGDAPEAAGDLVDHCLEVLEGLESTRTCLAP